MIIGFIGRMGSGKTLSMVRYAYAYYKMGYTIYSNIKFNFPYKSYTLDDLLNYANAEATFFKSVVIIDEAHIFLDSRNSASKRNKIISYFLLQTRKKDVKLFYTTQRFDQVDKRLRNNSDIIITCSTRKDPKGVSYTMNNIMFNLELGNKTKLNVFKSDKYYPLYNTYEVVKMI